MRSGVDTWSPCWYLDPEGEVAQLLNERATVHSARGSRLLPQPIAGHRVGWFPGTALAFAEGHPAAMLAGGPLASPYALRGALAVLVAQLQAELGVELPSGRTLKRPDGSRRPGFAGLRRLDITADLWFEDGREGVAVLEALSVMPLPLAPVQRVMTGPTGVVETVAWHGYAGRSMVARAYDKGIENGEAPRGQLIRLEDQRRRQSGRRMAVDDGTPAEVIRLFRERFAPLAAAPSVTVGDLDAIADRLADLVVSGRLRPSTAEKLAGFVLLGGRRSTSRATAYRHRARLRELGLHLARATVIDQAGERRTLGAVDVDLGRILDQALGAGAWEQLQREAAAAG